MTPANPDNNKPFIYRIADALGITHLVVAVQHSHLMSEIEGLISALAGKSDTGHTHKLIQYNQSASTDGFAGFTVTGAGSFTIGVQADKSISFQFGPYVKASITNSNVDNLARALRTPDSTPTANSDNLVTSGGVKAALDGKQDALTFDSTPTAGSTNPVTSGGVAAALAQKANKSLIDNTVSGIGRAFIQLGTDDETEIHVEIQVAKNGVTDNADITVDNMPNLQRALQTPDSTPTTNSTKLVTSGGVKAAMDVQKRINNRQLILTKTANGYQFVNSESDLPTFVNMIKSWGEEEDFVCANCIVITDGDAVAMPAMFNWAENSSYITIRAFIGCYLLEGDIRKNGSSYSSDMMMQLEDRSYVFSE